MLFLLMVPKACVSLCAAGRTFRPPPQPHPRPREPAGPHCSESALRRRFSQTEAPCPVSERTALLSVAERRPRMHFLPGFPERLRAWGWKDRFPTLHSGMDVLPLPVSPGGNCSPYAVVCASVSGWGPHLLPELLVPSLLLWQGMKS